MSTTATPAVAPLTTRDAGILVESARRAADHGNRLGTGDLDLISRDYTENVLFLTPGRTLKGRAGVRRGIGRLLADLPDAGCELTPQFAGDVLCLQRSATTTP